MRARTLAAALASLILLLAPRSAAQADPKQLLAEFKKDAKAEVKACKQALAARALDLQEDIAIFELGFDDLAGEDGPIDDLAAALIDYQTDAFLIVQDSSGVIGDLVAAAVDQLTPAGAGEDVFPTGFVLGDGGALDDALAQIDQAADKAAAAASKKLAKLTKKLRAKTDMRLAVLLRPQRARHVMALSGGVTSAHDASLVVDLVIGFNRGELDDDGRLWAAGFGGTSDGNVDLIVQGPTSEGGTAVPTVQNDRWEFVTELPLDEGNYLVHASQGRGSHVSRGIALL